MEFTVKLVVAKGQQAAALSRLRDVRMLVKSAGGTSKLTREQGLLVLTMDANAEALVQAVDMARRIETDALRQEIAVDKRAREYVEKNRKSDPYEDLFGPFGRGGRR